MPFKDLPEGQTHSYNDGCGEPAHNMPSIEKILEEFDREFASLNEIWRAGGHRMSDVLKSFLKQSFEKVYAEREKDLVEYLESRKGLFKNEFGDGYEAMIKDVEAYYGVTKPTSTPQ